MTRARHEAPPRALLGVTLSLGAGAVSAGPRTSTRAHRTAIPSAPTHSTPPTSSLAKSPSAAPARIDDVFAHVLGGTAGETFSIVLYDDNAGHLPGTLLHSATVTFSGDGWNGVSALSGWNVAAGSYWIGLEVGLDDTLGQASLTGALLDRGVPHPLSHTAFDAGGGYQSAALDFGLRVDATPAPVPEPESLALMLTGLGLLVPLTRRRRR